MEKTMALLPGEMVIAVAHGVKNFSPMSYIDNERVGSLFVTNYKISFVTKDLKDGCKQKNHLLGPYDIPLNLVDKVVQLIHDKKCGFKSQTRKNTLCLDPNKQPKNVTALQIICKNMRSMFFQFDASMGENKGTLIAMAILFHSFPTKLESLFTFIYSKPYTPSSDMDGINMFLEQEDWREEMKRTSCINFRVCTVRKVGNSALFRGPGYNIVVPNSIKETQLCDAVYFFFEGNIPIWVWTAPGGAALVRSGEHVNNFCKLFKSKGFEEPEATLIEATRRSHPKYVKPHVISIPQWPLHISFEKIKAICLPDNITSFQSGDDKFYEKLGESKWLQYVSECLMLATEAAGYLEENVSVILQEGDGIDYCPIISSLIQLLLDSHFRSIKGFQSLIQKEWVALGHPFCNRLGHISAPKSKEKYSKYTISPMFLIFLDCTWQLTQQFSAAFEFTDIYLITLWDSAHNQLFDTFIYNSPRHRETLSLQFKALRPVWEWHEQFTDDEIQFFYNPIYSPPQHPTHPENGCGCDHHTTFNLNLKPSSKYLKPHTQMECLDFWNSNYFRWISPANNHCPGVVHILLFNIRLAREYRRKHGQSDSTTKLVCPHPTSTGPFFPFH